MLAYLFSSVQARVCAWWMDWFYCLLVFIKLPRRGGEYSPVGRVPVVPWCLTPCGLERHQLWRRAACGVGQKHVLGVGVGLSYSTGPSPPKYFLLLLGFNTHHLGYDC